MTMHVTANRGVSHFPAPLHFLFTNQSTATSPEDRCVLTERCLLIGFPHVLIEYWQSLQTASKDLHHN